MSKCKDCKYCNRKKYNWGQWYCQSPKVSIFSLPVDTEKCFEPKKKYCSTCDYYAVEEGVCVCYKSENCADFRCLDDTCEHWEQKGE